LEAIVQTPQLKTCLLKACLSKAAATRLDAVPVSWLLAAENINAINSLILRSRSDPINLSLPWIIGISTR
jgi:hypothetical protein